MDIIISFLTNSDIIDSNFVTILVHESSVVTLMQRSAASLAPGFPEDGWCGQTWQTQTLSGNSTFIWFWLEKLLEHVTVISGGQMLKVKKVFYDHISEELLQNTSYIVFCSPDNMDVINNTEERDSWARSTTCWMCLCCAAMIVVLSCVHRENQ